MSKLIYKPIIVWETLSWEDYYEIDKLGRLALKELKMSQTCNILISHKIVYMGFGKFKIEREDIKPFEGAGIKENRGWKISNSLYRFHYPGRFDKKLYEIMVKSNHNLLGKALQADQLDIKDIIE